MPKTIPAHEMRDRLLDHLQEPRRHTYVIADLHGRFDLLEAALAAIEAHASQPGTIVVLGDFVDRGPQSRQVIERLMAGGAPGWTWIILSGNHEQMMLLCLAGVAQMDWWISNGGGSTLFSYGQLIGCPIDPEVVPEDHKAWLANLPYLATDDHRVYVHAGVDPNVSLDEQQDDVLLWKLHNSGDERGHGSRHVVHGHEQFAEGPMLYSGRSDLDTFAWLTGRLVVGVFDNEAPGGPVELIEVMCRPATTRDLTAAMVDAMNADNE